MQDDGQLWHDILWSSGGALNLQKCSYHHIRYAFTDAGEPFLSGNTSGTPLALSSADGSPQSIQQKSSYDVHKTLGVHKSPSGEHSKQLAILKKKSDDHGRTVATSPFTRRDAWTYYFAIWLTSVGYPLPSCSFTFSQLDDAQRKAINAILSRCGYNRSTHRAVIFGPACLGGASYRHLWVEQGVFQVTCFLKHWRLPATQLGKLLRIAVAWFQAALGTGVSFLTDTETPLPHFESKWLRSLRLFLSHCDASLTLDNSHVPELQREGDTHIMDTVLASNRFTSTQICKINYCRLYLQAMTLSDICVADGTRLDSEFFFGRIPPGSAYTTWHSFTQDRPSETSWRLWRKACRLFAGEDGALLINLGT